MTDFENNLRDVMAFGYSEELARKALNSVDNDIDAALDWLQSYQENDNENEVITAPLAPNEENDVKLEPTEKEPVVKDQAYYAELAKKIAAQKDSEDRKKFFSDEQRRREEGKAAQQNQEKFEKIRKDIERSKEERERALEKERKRRILEKVRMEKEMRRDNNGRLVDADGNDLIIDNSTISNEYKVIDIVRVGPDDKVKLKLKGADKTVIGEFSINAPLREVFVYARKNGIVGKSVFKIGAPGPYPEQSHGEYSLHELGITAPTMLQLR